MLTLDKFDSWKLKEGALFLRNSWRNVSSPGFKPMHPKRN